MKTILEFVLHVVAIAGLSLWLYQLLELTDTATKYLKFKMQPKVYTIILKHEAQP